MKCHICNATLGETEIRFNRRYKSHDPCGTCLEVINETIGELKDEEEEEVTIEDLENFEKTLDIDD